MENINLKIAKRVKSCRKEHNMTQEQLADKSGYSVQHISGIENCRRKMTVETAHIFSKVFNINYEYFLGEEPYRNLHEKEEFNNNIFECIDNSYKQLMQFLGFRISPVIYPKDCKNIYDEACVIVEDYNEEISYFKITYRDYLEIRRDILTYAQYRFSKGISSSNPDDLRHLNIEQISKNMAMLENENSLGIGWDVFEFLEKIEQEDIENGVKFAQIIRDGMK